MNIFRRMACLVLITVGFGAAAQTGPVNIPAAVDYRDAPNSFTKGVERTLDAGQYLVYSMGRADGSPYLYDAWDYGFGGYLNQYFINGPTGTTFVGSMNPGNAGWKIFGTPAEALSVAKSTLSPHLLQLASPATVRFGIADSYYGDNSGGISLLVLAVPEPHAYALLLSGLCLVGMRVRRTRRRQDHA